MNKLSFTFLLASAIAFAACSGGGSDGGDDSTTPQTQGSITLSSSQSITVDASGGTETINFTATGAWTASVASGIAWLSVSPTSGAAGSGSVNVKVNANDTYDERNAAVTLKCGTATKTVTVTQKQKDALILTSDKVELSEDGGSFSIELKANVDVTCEIEAAAQSWLKESNTRALTTRKLSFTAEANDAEETRQAVITLKGNGLEEKVTVYQYGTSPRIVLTQNEYVVSSDGETIQVELKSNTTYEVQMPDVDWISEASTRALSSYTHYFTVSPNEGYDSREAEIVFVNKENNLSESVKVTQVQKNAIVVAKSEYEIPAEGGQLDFQVQTNVELEVSVSDSWITQRQTRALTAKDLYFDIAANAGNPNSREGTITIKGKGSNVVQTIKVTQVQEDAIVVAKSEYEIPAGGGQLDFQVQTNVELEVSVSDSWIMQRETRALTTKNLYFDIAANADKTSSREGTITIKGKGSNVVQTIKVMQVQEDAIVVAKSEYDMPASGGQLDFQVQTNVELDISVSDSWITQRQTRALTTKDLYFDIAANTDETNSREGVITIKGKESDVVQTIKVKQARYTNIVEVNGTSATVNLDEATDAGDVQTAINEADGKGVTKYVVNGDFSKLGIELNGMNISNPFQNTNAEEIDMSGVTNFTSLPDYAFYLVNKIKKLTLPETVTTLGEKVFFKVSTLETIIAKGVTTFGEYTFYNPTYHNQSCLNLSTVDMPELTTIPHTAFCRTSITEANFPKLTEIPDNAFMGCTKLSKTNLASVKSVGVKGMAYCRALKELELPALETIDVNAFTQCEKLQTASFPKLTEAGGGAFAGCYKLESVSMPALTTVTGNFLFQLCYKLSTVELPSLTTPGAFMFGDGCTGLTSVSMPVATDIPEGTFKECTKLASVELPAATTIGTIAFSKCTSLVSVELPAAITIGQRAFYKCTSLTSLNLPAATSLGASFLSEVNSVTTLRLTATGDISISDVTNSASIDLILNADKKSEVTVPGDDAESWELPQWKGLDFKSISFEE